MTSTRQSPEPKNSLAVKGDLGGSEGGPAVVLHIHVKLDVVLDEITAVVLQILPNNLPGKATLQHYATWAHILHLGRRVGGGHPVAQSGSYWYQVRTRHNEGKYRDKTQEEQHAEGALHRKPAELRRRARDLPESKAFELLHILQQVPRHEAQQ